MMRSARLRLMERRGVDTETMGVYAPLSTDGRVNFAPGIIEASKPRILAVAERGARVAGAKPPAVVPDVIAARYALRLVQGLPEGDAPAVAGLALDLAEGVKVDIGDRAGDMLAAARALLRECDQRDWRPRCDRAREGLAELLRHQEAERAEYWGNNFLRGLTSQQRRAREAAREACLVVRLMMMPPLRAEAEIEPGDAPPTHMTAGVVGALDDACAGAAAGGCDVRKALLDWGNA